MIWLDLSLYIHVHVTRVVFLRKAINYHRFVYEVWVSNQTWSKKLNYNFINGLLIEANLVLGSVTVCLYIYKI